MVRCEGWFNVKMPSYQFRDPHDIDKMVSQLSDLYNGNPCTGKMTFLYWLRAQCFSTWPSVQWSHRYMDFSLQNKCWTADPDRQNLGRSGKLSFFTIYKFWQNCASVRQVSDLILKTRISIIKIRLSQDHLVLIMGIPILVRQHPYIETCPWSDLYLMFLIEGIYHMHDSD